MGSLVQAHPEAQSPAKRWAFLFGLSPTTKVVVLHFVQAAKPEQAHPEAQSPAKCWAFLLGLQRPSFLLCPKQGSVGCLAFCLDA